MKKIFLAALLLCLSTCLFASTYKIMDYSFLVSGKTQGSSLAEILGDGGETFDSVEKLKTFLDEKKQDLVNMRLFSKVEYQYYTTQDIPDFYNVYVTFYISDASSIFVLPYPKYDSNYGFKLGIKAYNKNLWGRFTNLYGYFGFSQQENAFKYGKFDWELSLDEISLGKAKLAVSHLGAIDLLNWDRSYLGLEAEFDEFTIGDMSSNASIGFKFAPEGTAKDSSWSLQNITAGLGIEFTNHTLNNSALYNSITFLPNTFELDTNSRFSYEIQYGIYSQTVLNTEQINKPDDVNDGLNFIELGTGISRAFDVTEKLKFNTLFMVYLQYDYDAEIFTSYFDLAFTSSYSRINWEGNFRRGFSYNTRADLLTYPFNETDRTSIKMWGTASGFLPVTSWFNPSARISFTASDRDQFFAFNENNTVSDYIRGVRLDNWYVHSENAPMRKFSMAINLDLMLNFVTIRDFCKSYVVPLVDVLLVNDRSNDEQIKCITTVGGEGIVILDNFPSYPIRGSLGVNANDLVEYMKGSRDLSDVEFEIYIGMGFFY